MKVELPELKRCCFCIPLRHGLIVWGYIKLITFLILTSFITFAFVSFKHHLEEKVLISIYLLLLAVDICLTIVFLVGGHRKSAKLLHVYYIYNIVVLCLYTLFFTWTTAVELMYMGSYVEDMPHGYLTFIPVTRMKLLVGIANLGIQAYVILLLRSEVNKLRNSFNYRFGNPTVEVNQSLENGTNVTLLLLSSFITVACVQYPVRFGHHLEEIVLTSILLLILVLDICLTIVFLVGGHRKSAKLLHVYYIYNIVVLCLYTLFFTWSTALELTYMGSYVEYMPHGYVTFVPLIQIRLLFGISSLGIQVYIILLLRSEVNKLRNNFNYRFGNPTVEVRQSLENGTSEQEISYSNVGTNENGTDSQFEGIINQTKKAGVNFNYNKL